METEYSSKAKGIMRETEAGKIVQEGVNLFFKEMKKGGCPMGVGYGDIKTEEDLAEIRLGLETSGWEAIKKGYTLLED